MSKIYQYTSSGYFAGEAEFYGVMPNNSTKIAPKLKEGFIPRWAGEAWEQVENHKGKIGYLNGEPHTIKDYGPLPDDWSDTPPPPTTEEKAAWERAKRDGLLAETDYLLMPDYPISDESKATVVSYRQALRDVTAQAGFPDVIDWPKKPKM